MAKAGTSGSGVAVIGLGRFGGQVAESLERLGHEVLAIDNDPVLVQKWADRLTHVVEADSTDEDALRQVGITEFPRAVVGIGTDIEASALTVIGLTSLAVPEIWAKAVTAKHGQILHRIGAHHVVYPEAAMGERVAHLVTGKMIDFIEFDDDYAIGKTKAPQEAAGRTLGESVLRTKYGVTIVAVKRPGQDFTYALPETVVERGDLLIVSGRTKDVERFAAVT
ncbi:MAG: potassium channel family protein [Micromonosporaceae bacterium]